MWLLRAKPIESSDLTSVYLAHESVKCLYSARCCWAFTAAAADRGAVASPMGDGAPANARRPTRPRLHRPRRSARGRLAVSRPREPAPLGTRDPDAHDQA